MDLILKRSDGSFVATVNGRPYHIVEGDEPLYAEAVAMADSLGDDLEFEPPSPEPLPAPTPDKASKLGLKRALDEIGRWAEVRAALEANPDLKEDWDLAVEVRRADPVTQAMIALLGLSEAEVDAILVRAVAIVGM